MQTRVRRIVATSALGLLFLLRAPADAAVATPETAEARAWDILSEAGPRSSDLRVRIVYSRRITEDSDGAYRSSEVIPVETLVDQARGSTDPVVLSLMVDRCSDDLRKAGRCDAVDLARRWTVADTQNQLAWVALSTALGVQGDAESARATFRRAAEASQWHEYSPEVARSIEAIVPKTTDAATRADLLRAVLTKSWGNVPSEFLTINQRCKEVDLRDACGRILDVMTRDARTLMTLNTATRLATSRNLPSPATAASMRQRSDAMWWAVEHRPDISTTDTAAQAARVVAALEAQIASNEIEVLRTVLQEAKLTESMAAQKYVASLSPAQVAYRMNGVSKAVSSTP